MRATDRRPRICHAVERSSAEPLPKDLKCGSPEARPTDRRPRRCHAVERSSAEPLPKDLKCGSPEARPTVTDRRNLPEWVRRAFAQTGPGGQWPPAQPWYFATHSPDGIIATLRSDPASFCRSSSGLGTRLFAGALETPFRAGCAIQR